MQKIAKIARIGNECVACGCCIPVCPKAAIKIISGVTARVDGEICIGCGKCARICPADVILITVREVAV